MIFFKRFLDYAIFACAILLGFLLVFESRILLPGLVEWIGRWHPVVLHFPVVLILVTVFAYWRKDGVFDWLLGITTLFTFITSITGFLLSLEGETKGDLIVSHQWLGVSVTYIMTFWYYVNQFAKQNSRIPIILQGLLVLLIVVTGHYGGMVTHGRDFLSFSPKDEEAIVSIPENPVIFQHIIQPILEDKCISCHNPDKSKGGLLLSDYASILQGGEHGEIIDFSDPDNSQLLATISLPVDDEGHMPPKDEDQLAPEEKILISEWIQYGAREDLLFTDLDMEGKSHELIAAMIAQSQMKKWKDLPELSDEDIDEHSTNYIRIVRSFSGTDALQVIVYPHKEYRNSDINSLKPIAKNIVELNLSGLPISDEELEFVALCSNLEKLNISNTPLEDGQLNSIVKLANLQDLKVYNTGVTGECLNFISELPGIRSVYVYNTGISEERIKEFAANRPDVRILSSSELASSFKSVLPPPLIHPKKYFFSEPFSIKFEHPLDGINMLYATDPSRPLELYDVAGDSVLIDHSLQLKYYAAREGWETSPVDSIQFLRTLGAPDRFTLENDPNERFQGKGDGLLFDMEKGSVDFFSDSAWMAYREEDFILKAYWEEPKTIGSVVISSIVHTDPYLFPPESILIRGGADESSMSVLSRMEPDKLEERSGRYFQYYTCDFQPESVHFIELRVKPLQRIPMWHPGKGEKGWFFIDEVVFQAN